MSKWCEILCDLLIIGIALVFMVVGVIEQSAYPAGFTGQEPNLAILIIELAMSTGMVVLGIERLLHDTREGFREVMGDVVVVSSGVILLGIFITIIVNSKFIMYQVEPLFILTRFGVASGILLLGIDRFVGDARK